MKLVFALSMTVLSVPAFAGSTGLSFDDLKEACQNPGKFQNQIAPTNLQISCEEKVSNWQASTSKEMDLPCTRQITTSITSDKYDVSPSIYPMSVDSQKGSCPSFKEVLEVTSFTKATSCDELLNWKGTKEEFCADIIDRARQDNPKMVQIQDTGRVMEFCSEQGKGQGQDQGKGKGQGQSQGQGPGQGYSQGQGQGQGWGPGQGYGEGQGRNRHGGRR